ncbi:hypothetical protein SLEP1_g22716 [Rubroshorea leprosula]|uniref:Uncharacterized protein n=1 Tax=Rubroshorea leprosula TaxID=152421 RepID=A0AAV5JD16_9ROSI|nr:hypothetical protein SLEP1_g22716 [Rubroshorea leprosula]
MSNYQLRRKSRELASVWPILEVQSLFTGTVHCVLFTGTVHTPRVNN